MKIRSKASSATGRASGSHSCQPGQKRCCLLPSPRALRARSASLLKDRAHHMQQAGCCGARTRSAKSRLFTPLPAPISSRRASLGKTSTARMTMLCAEASENDDLLMLQQRAERLQRPHRHDVSTRTAAGIRSARSCHKRAMRAEFDTTRFEQAYDLIARGGKFVRGEIDRRWLE